MKQVVDRYRIKEYHFKPEERAKIEAIMVDFQHSLIEVKMGSYLEDGQLSYLGNANLNTLNKIVNTWPDKIYELSLVHYKTEITKEYDLLKNLIDGAKGYIVKINDNITKLEETLRNEFSSTISSNSFFSNYFSYKDFKDAFLEEVDPSKVSFYKTEDLIYEKIFDKIRKKIISERSNLTVLMSLSERSVLHISQIQKQDERTYELITSEFFVNFCQNSLGISVPYGKRNKTEILRPSHSIAEKLKIGKTEMVYLTVSLEPIQDPMVNTGDTVEFNNGLKFEVTQPPQMVSKEIFYPINLNKNSTCNFIVPIFFSFIRCNLVKEQRSDHLKPAAAGA